MLGIRAAGENSRIQDAPAPAEAEYATVDSVQPGYAVERSAWVAPAFILMFTVMSAAVLLAEATITATYREALVWVYGPSSSAFAGESVGLRPFFITVALLIPLFSQASVLKRTSLALRITVPVLVVMFLIDSALLRTSAFGFPAPFSVQGQIITGLAAVATMIIAIFQSYNFPASNPVPTLRKRQRRYLFLFAAILVASVTVVVLSLGAGRSNIEIMRDLGLIGGIGPGIALLAPVFNLFRFIVAWLMFHSRNSIKSTLRLDGARNADLQDWLDKVASGEVAAPTVSFLVPAHNEGDNIAATIASMDMAALRYPGVTRVIIVDNNSTDQTYAISQRALRECEFISGQVLECSEPGKSKALNMGLENLDSEVMVRVDADTVLEADCLSKIAMHFANPEVGGVGGLPLPLNESGWFSRVRRVEVYHNVAWNRVGQMAMDSVIVVPGMLSAFRTHLVRSLGGFVEGINGEDTDMTVRVGRSGYRIVVDPNIKFRTEVPTDVSHMREQRLRWSRGVFHVFTRNVSAFWMRQGVRGMWLMPLSAFGFFRRALIPLLVIYAGLAAIINPDLLNLRHGAVFIAILFGPEFLITILALLVHRQFKAILSVPDYFVFRFMRGYIALETLLSLHQKLMPARETVRQVSPARASGMAAD